MDENQNEQNNSEKNSKEIISCPSCGEQVSENDKFCIHCGAKLAEDISEDTKQKAITTPKRRSSSVVAWLIAFALMIVILVTLSFATVSSMSNEKASSTNATTTQSSTSVPELTTITRSTKSASTTTTSEVTTAPATTTTVEKTSKATTTTTEATTKATTTTTETTTKATTKEDKTVEITFRDIPWGTSYADAKEMVSELGLWKIVGDGYKTYSIDQIVLGDSKGINFERDDINIIGCTTNGKIEVAGYTTEDIKLFFAYVPVNGVLTKTEEDSALYGARYEFEPLDLDKASKDLEAKLTSLYGNPDSTKKDSDFWGNKYKYIYWTGANNTEVVLKIQDSSESTWSYDCDTIYISYIWLKGDELLQTACDTLIQNEKDAESKVYGDGSTGGL